MCQYGSFTIQTCGNETLLRLVTCTSWSAPLGICFSSVKGPSLWDRPPCILQLVVVIIVPNGQPQRRGSQTAKAQRWARVSQALMRLPLPISIDGQAQFSPSTLLTPVPEDSVRRRAYSAYFMPTFSRLGGFLHSGVISLRGIHPPVPSHHRAGLMFRLSAGLR